jgi:hypothetical protein
MKNPDAQGSAGAVKLVPILGTTETSTPARAFHPIATGKLAAKYGLPFPIAGVIAAAAGYSAPTAEALA